MLSVKKVVVILLLVSLVFSVLSVVLTLSLNSIRPSSGQNIIVQSPGGSTAGGLGISIEPPTGAVGGGAP